MIPVYDMFSTKTEDKNTLIGLSAIEYKILEMCIAHGGYSVPMDGPWWMKLLYDFGILQIYINRLIEKGLIEEVRVGWNYIDTMEGFWTYLDYIQNDSGNIV